MRWDKTVGVWSNEEDDWGDLNLRNNETMKLGKVKDFKNNEI